VCSPDIDYVAVSPRRVRGLETIIKDAHEIVNAALSSAQTI
jgi:hypothetical protein